MKTPLLLSLLLAVLVMPSLAEESKPPSGGPPEARVTTVPFTDLKAAESYQSFVRNWDDAKSPVLCAVIRDGKDWNNLMGPAAKGMGIAEEKPKFGPDGRFYGSQQILLVARVMEGKDLLNPVQVTLGDDGVLTFSYGMAEPAKKAGSKMSWPLAISIPKDIKFNAVVFVENGKEVGRAK